MQHAEAALCLRCTLSTFAEDEVLTAFAYVYKACTTLPVNSNLHKLVVLMYDQIEMTWMGLLLCIHTLTAAVSSPLS